MHAAVIHMRRALRTVLHSSHRSCFMPPSLAERAPEFVHFDARLPTSPSSALPRARAPSSACGRAGVSAMSGVIGAFANVAHKFVTWPQLSTQGFCNVIKIGTFCRTVVWPCIPPLLMYQYIRGVDEDVYATEVLYYKSGSKDVKAFHDSSRIGISGHWRLQQDLETIREAANPE